MLRLLILSSSAESRSRLRHAENASGSIQGTTEDNQQQDLTPILRTPAARFPPPRPTTCRPGPDIASPSRDSPAICAAVLTAVLKRGDF